MSEVTVVDLRGLPHDAVERKTAYPRESSFELGRPMRYLHLLSTSWYFDASSPDMADEARRVIRDLICASRQPVKSWHDGYVPVRVVIDNYGGTVIGERREER